MRDSDSYQSTNGITSRGRREREYDRIRESAGRRIAACAGRRERLIAQRTWIDEARQRLYQSQGVAD